MTKIEIFCIYNNEQILNECLINSLKTQNMKHRLIIYDGHKSPVGAAYIYNRLLSQSEAEVIICCHHDIVLESPNVLSEIYEYLHINDNCIIGAAGAVLENRKKIVYGNISDGEEKLYRLKHIEQPVEVLALDECLIAFNRKVFDKVRMDDKTCTGWHFYSADMCYAGRSVGVKSYAFPLNLWHLSSGKIGNDFYVQLSRVRKKYLKKGEKYFVTPCIKYNLRISPILYKYKRKIMLWRMKVIELHTHSNK